MTPQREITCVIQARKQSTRLPNKMLRPFAGSTLLETALKIVQQCRRLDPQHLYLSACEEEIQAVGRKLGVQIYERPASSVAEGATLQQIFAYANAIPGEHFLIINPCNPLLTSGTIDRAIAYFQGHPVASLFSVVKRRNYFFDRESRIVNPLDPERKALKRFDTQIIEPLYEAAHSIYLFRAEYLRKHLMYWSFTKDDPYLFEIPEEELFDIDHLWQFELAEQMCRLRRDPQAKPGPTRSGI